MRLYSIIKTALVTVCICFLSYSLIAAYAHFLLIEPKIKLGQVISFNNPNDEFTNEILSQGWSTPESWGVWSNGEKAILMLPNPGPNVSKLIIDARAFISINVPVQHIHFQIDNQPAIEVSLNLEDKNLITLPIDSSAHANKIIKIQITFRNAASPKDFGLGDDSRKIAIGIKSLEFSN